MGTMRSVIAAAALAAAVIAVPAARAADPPACAPSDVEGGEWRSYGHDASNTRSQPEASLAAADAVTLAPAWTFSSTGAGGSGDFTGTPVVADGCLFVASNGGWVYTLNADTGELVWKAQVPNEGAINSSVAVDSGRVFVAVSKTSAPYVAAFDQATGELAWASDPVDVQAGSDSYASPVVFDGVVVTGVSGGAAELGDQTDRYAFQGSIIFQDAATGDVLKKTWTIHSPDEPDDGFAGAAVWSTPAVDPEEKAGYVGTGNPFQPEKEHDHANAVVRFDLDRASPTFGNIVGSYKGNIDEYLPGYSELPCFKWPGGQPTYPQGVGSCGDIDLDFGASPNIFEIDDRNVVGAGQKSGVYHVFDAANMEPVWTAVVGPPTPVGGIVGSTAFDGQSVFGPVTVPGHLWSVNGVDGGVRWVSATADGVHWGNPVAEANGVIYTVDFKGFLDAYDAATGAPLLHRPLIAGSDTGVGPVLSWGGVSVARDTVYATSGISGLPDGFIVAFRPGGGDGGGEGGGGGGGDPELPGVPEAPGEAARR